MAEPLASAEWAQQIAAAFEAACRDEIDAPKPGNVHLFADGHRMTAADFVRSAAVAAPPLAATGARVGARIHNAVTATFASVGANTNLGIVLLCAPLAAAAEPRPSDLRSSLAAVLRGLDREDAANAFAAIVRASPAGLGRAERHDVFAPPHGTLYQAMADAADRDRIARQYVTGFEDVFELGEKVFADALGASSDRRRAILAVFLCFLAAFCDTHIVRKHGEETAELVRVEASALKEKVQAAGRLDDVLPAVLAWDSRLKEAAINPGTSADLTVATLFVHRLRSILPPRPNSA